MCKSFFFLSIYSFFFISSAFSLNLMDITDESKDKNISIKYLPDYIRAIHKSRVDYLKERIDHLQDENNRFVLLGSARGGWQVVTDHAALLDENSAGAVAQKLLLQAYKRQYDFFKNDPLVLYKNPTTPYPINPSSLDDLTLLFWHTARIIRQSHTNLQLINNLPSHSPDMSMLLEPAFYNEESAIEDLITILRVIRPHLNKAIKSKAKLGPQGKKTLEEGKSVLKEIALFNTAYQWRELFSKPEIQRAYCNSLIKIDIDVEEKPSLSVTRPSPETQQERQKPETAQPTGLQKEEKKEKSTHVTSKKVNNNQAVPEARSQNLPTVDHERQQVPASPRRDKKTKKKPTVAPQDEKTKTRPAEETLFLQSLNGYFEEDPIAKVKEKLKAPQDPEAKREHTQRLKVLQKLLYSDKTNNINVDKTARLLEHFGLVESSDLNHGKMIAKPLELWLKGERVLIEVPPVVTMAVGHKSGSKRYFKPYVVKRLRDALLKAGFSKLLQ